MSQNVLGRSKLFGPDQNLNCIYLVLLQKILCRHNNWIYWMELMFWSCTKFGTCTICKSILALTQKIWTIPKSFATCRRIRHRSIFCVLAAPIEGTGLPLEKPVRIRSAIVLILLQLWQIHAYSIWTFISPNIFIFFFNSFFYSIAITFWISSKFFNYYDSGKASLNEKHTEMSHNMEQCSIFCNWW